MNIEINDRLYNDFVVWAQANDMNEEDMHRYIERAFRDKFMLDKYGDLNEKLKEIKTEKKPRKTTRKKNEEVTEDVNGDVNEDVNEGYKIKPEGNPYPTKPAVFDSKSINEQINEEINEQINEEITPKRKTKVINSK